VAFFPSLPGDAKLLQVFALNRETALPLVDYHENLMRGESPLSVAQRELLAAYVSGLNQCQYCHGIHAEVAQAFGVPADLLGNLLHGDAVPEDAGKLRPILDYARKLTLQPMRLTQADAQAVFRSGWSERALHDAIAICALFNFMNRIVLGHGLRGDPDYAALAGARLAREGYAPISERLQDTSEPPQQE